MKNRERLYGLDLFRIILALLIFGFHTIINFGCQYGFLQAFIKHGAIAMSAFFLLSGYSLFYVYQEHELHAIKNLTGFYKKRIISIFPVYYSVALVYVLFFSSESVLQWLLLAPVEMLGVQSTFNSLFNISHNGITWFISCILICYFVFPLIQIICKQIKFRGKIFLIAICAFLLFLSPFVVKVFDLSSVYANPFFRLLEFIIGVCFSTFSFRATKSKKAKMMYKIVVNRVTTLILFLWIVAFASTNITSNYMVLSVGTLFPFVIIIYNLGHLEFGRFLNNRIILYFSSLSYCFFLSQLFMPVIGRAVFGYFHFTNIVQILILFIICFVISVLLHELIEKPVGKLLKHMLFR